MSLLRTVANRASIGSSLVQSLGRRSNYIVSGPPRNRVSFVEKMALGLTIVSSILIIPMWVMGNLDSYKGRPPAEAEAEAE